jgi:lipopolysaccharide transport system permease protein
MLVNYERQTFDLDSATRRITARFRLVNRSNYRWSVDGGFAIGWQIYDPETSTFIAEGEWTSLPQDLASAQTADIELSVQLPPERGRYHVYVSPVAPKEGWFYTQGEPFLLIDAFVEHGAAQLIEAGVTTVGSLRRRKLRRAIKKVFTLPFTSIWRNRSLIASISRRDVSSRYRGSFGDVLWTVLNPLLLMATYFFVFGIVLKARFGDDQSKTAFAFYFLAGMLPWLAFSEAIGRAPNGIVENRVLVKKVVFPVEILPVTQVISGLITQAFAAAIFIIALLIFRGWVPPSIGWLPALLVPQLLFTLGLAWFLSATGVYLRDIGQIIGFVLTLWFFLTPICYPEALLPAGAKDILTKNPIYVLVRGYRAIFLDGQAPPLGALWKLWIVSAVAFLAGYAWFHKLRKSFADVI